MNKFFTLFLIFLIISAGAAEASTKKYRKGGESRPYSDYDFIEESFPQSDPSMIEPEPVAEAADPDNLDFQPLGDGYECNTCAGANYTESYAQLPKRAQGIWAYPDCSDTQGVLLQSDYFSMWSGKGQTICLEPVTDVEEYPLFSSVTTKSGTTYIEITNDGLMLTGLPPETVSDVLKKKYVEEEWDIEKASENMTREYTSCGFYPKEEFELLIYSRQLVTELDDMVRNCYVPNYHNLDETQKRKELKSCGAFLLNKLDLDQSRSLDYEELTEATTKAFLTRDAAAGCVSGQVFRRYRNDLILTIVNDMIGTLDKDGDLKLSIEELSGAHTFLRAMKDPEAQLIYSDLMNLYPFLMPVIHIDLSKIKYRD
jgi:hypothetical protein